MRRSLSSTRAGLLCRGSSGTIERAQQNSEWDEQQQRATDRGGDRFVEGDNAQGIPLAQGVNQVCTLCQARQGIRTDPDTRACEERKREVAL